ncbi:hypothetical protein Hanom_Chr02g00145401 [Helianthus anomalus]
MDVLGIPMGHVEVTNVERPTMSYPIIAQWRNHVKYASTLPKVGKIADFIEASND